MTRYALLACGIASSLFHVVLGVLGALTWEGYRNVLQSISKPGAIGAPSRPVVEAPAFRLGAPASSRVAP